MAPTTLSSRAPMGVCNTPACNALSKTLLSNVNLNIDPCSDFFKFTCGNWLNTDPVKEQTTSFSLPEQTQTDSLDIILSFLNGTFEDLTHQIQEKDPNYLSEKDKVNVDKENFNFVQNYYNSCLDIKARTALGFTSIFPHVAHVENNLFPYNDNEEIDPKKLAEALVVSTLQDLPTILYISAGKNPKDHEYLMPSIQLFDLECGVDYNDIDSLNEYKSSLAKALSHVLGGPSSDDYSYERFVIEESRKSNFTLWSPSKIELAISRFIDFEIQLSKLQYISTENESDTMPTYKGLKNASSLISWDTFFTTLISNDYIKSNPTISFDKNQLMILDSLLTETPVKTLQEYWIIKTVRAKAFALRTESSTSDSQMLSNKYFQKSFRAPSSRDAATSTPQEICGKETSESFKHIVGRFFALSTFGGPEERNQAEDFVDVIHSTWLHDMLPKTSWIGDETKKTIIEKTEFLRKRVVYSTTSPNWNSPASLKEYYKDLKLDADYFNSLYAFTSWKNSKLWATLPNKIDRNEWSERNYPEQANASYDPEENLIEIPIGFFQKPFYNPQYPEYINYGGLGAIIGHEFTHSLDSKGISYDKNGYYTPNLFTEADSKTYVEKSQCFIDQFGKFTLTGSDDEALPLNGTKVLGENIADNGGIRIAYNAYLNLIKKRASPEKTLPGFEKYSPEQLFFISHGQFTCATVQKSDAERSIKTYDHAPFYYRNIGAFQNSDEFAKVFNCPVGSPMNPKKKCSIW